MKKKITALVMTAVMMASTISCGKAEDTADIYQYRGIDTSGPPVTITYLTIGDKPINGMTEQVVDKLNEILLKRANAKLDIYYIGWNDYLENYDKILDMVSVNVDLVATGSDWLDAWPNAVKGNFMALSDEMLQKCCPQTYKNVSAKEWRCCTYNDKIYFIPENEYTQWINHGFVYRGDIARDAGLESITSWSDLDRYFKYIKDNNPNMIPWDTDGTNTRATLGYIMSKKKYVPIYELGIYGVWGTYKDVPSKIVSPYYDSTEFVDYAILMKKWFKMGVWRTDSKTSTDDFSSFYNGDAAVVQHHTQNFYTIIKPNMEIFQPDSNTKFFWFGQENGNLVKTSILHGAMAVSKKCRNPERALMVYDLLRNDPECYRLINYGIEGVQYQVNNKGMLEKPSGYNAERDGIVTDFWWGRRDDYELKDSSFAWSDYNELTSQYDKVAIDYQWDRFPFASSIIGDKTSRILEVCDKYLPEIASGNYDASAEEEVANFRRALKEAGMDDVTRILQSIYDESDGRGSTQAGSAFPTDNTGAGEASSDASSGASSMDEPVAGESSDEIPAATDDVPENAAGEGVAADNAGADAAGN